MQQLITQYFDDLVYYALPYSFGDNFKVGTDSLPSSLGLEATLACVRTGLRIEILKKI